jgi:uncharacterized protein (DUF1501 family)
LPVFLQANQQQQSLQLLETDSMNRTNTRRTFLGTSAAAATGMAATLASPAPWLRALAGTPATHDARVLVVIQLSGGNDGLNTVIPHADDEYRRVRPKLAIPDAEIIKLDDSLGFHPSLSGAARLFEAGRLSIVQGVGYAAPNRSHFESMDIWHTCHFKSQRSGDGWLGRYLAELNAGHGAAADAQDPGGLHLGREQQPLALLGRGVQVPSVASIEQFTLQAAKEGLLVAEDSRAAAMSEQPEQGDAPALLEFLESTSNTAITASQRLNEILSTASEAGRFPESDLGNKLGTIAKLILAGISTRVYYVNLDGFDTHALQPQTHAALLRQWSDAVTAFVDCLQAAGESERVLMLTFSEFGRRVAENASLGTDHGAAAPVFLAGPNLRQSIHGDMPSLTDLDDGDQKFHTDFRQVYATLIESWFQSSNSASILGGQYQPLDLLRTM